MEVQKLDEIPFGDVDFIFEGKAYKAHKTSFGTLYCGDCLDLLPKLSIDVDFVLADPPYGTTACKWDVIIPFDKLWGCIHKCVHNRTPIVLCGSEPFSSMLRMSNIKEYKYDWVWSKNRGTGFQIVKYKPLCSHENIIVFYKKAPTYNPQMREREKPRISKNKGTTRQMLISKGEAYEGVAPLTKRYPITVIEFPNNNQRDKKHPTQKPVALMEYLINTYTNMGDTVLDFSMGSGTTCVAAVHTGRKFVGIEKDEHYYSIAVERLKEAEGGR